jgi:hypothetical protein
MADCGSPPSWTDHAGDGRQVQTDPVPVPCHIPSRFTVWKRSVTADDLTVNVTGEQITAVGGVIAAVLTALSPPLTEWVRNRARRTNKPQPATVKIPRPRTNQDQPLVPYPPRRTTDG